MLGTMFPVLEGGEKSFPVLAGLGLTIYDYTNIY